MANNNVVVIYDQLQSAQTKLDNYYTLLQEQHAMIERLDSYFDTLYERHGKSTTFVASMEDEIEKMHKAVKNDLADIDYLKNLINYIIQSYTDAEGKTTTRSSSLLLTALGSLVPAGASAFTTSIYGNMGDYSTAISQDATKAADVTQYSELKNWHTYADTNATSADAWDAIHENSSSNGTKYSYKLNETASKISTEAENVVAKDMEKDVEEAQAKAKAQTKALAEKEKALAEKENELKEQEEAQANNNESPQDTYTETEQVDKVSDTKQEAKPEPVTKEEPAAQTDEATEEYQDGYGEDDAYVDVEPTVDSDTSIDTETGLETGEDLPSVGRKSSSGASKVVPIIAGTAAAGAAGVGAKIILDKKNETSIDKEESWDENISIEKNEADEGDNYLDSSDEFTYKTDIDNSVEAPIEDDDTFSDVTEEDDVEGYQTINFNDVTTAH